MPSHICRRKQKAILKLSKNFEKRFRTQNLEQIFVIRKTHRQPRIRLKVGTKSYRPIIKSLEKSFYGYVLPFLSWPKQHFLMSCKKNLLRFFFVFCFPTENKLFLRPFKNAHSIENKIDVGLMSQKIFSLLFTC